MAHESLNWKQVREMRKDRVAGMTTPKLAVKYGVSRPQVSKIVNHKCWREKTEDVR